MSRPSPRVSSRSLVAPPAVAKPTADASAVVDLLLRGADGSDQQSEEKLRVLLTSAPYTPAHLLQVIRSLPDAAAALRFFEWCRSQDSSSLASASALHGPSAYQAIFELAARQRGPQRPSLTLKHILDRSTEQEYALTLDSAALLVRAFGAVGMAADVLRVVRGLTPSIRTAGVCNGALRVLFGTGDPRYQGEAVALVREMVGSSHPRCRPDAATGFIVYATLLRRERVVDGDAAALVAEMAEQGVFPSDEVQFSQLISELCWCRQTDGAWRFLHAVKGAGGAVGTLACNSLLAGVAREGDIQRMNILF